MNRNIPIFTKSAAEFKAAQAAEMAAAAKRDEIGDMFHVEHMRIALDDVKLKFLSDDDDESDLGEFSGYGAITGNKDSHGDIIQKGAFKSTLREFEDSGKLPQMLLQHGGFGFGSVDDALPVGVWTEMIENSKGLKVTGKLFALDTDRGKTIYAGLKSGVLDGLSIGYRPVKYTLGTKPTQPRRTLEAVDLVEVSIVTQPANPKARVGQVKCDIREFEKFLRDEGGFSRRAAEQIALSGYKDFRPEPRDEDGDAHTLNADPRDEDELKAAIAGGMTRLVNVLNPKG